MVVTTPKWLAEHNIDERELSLWANIVLGWTGESTWQPSSWERAFLGLAAASDSDNMGLLLKTWPAATAAWIIWKEGDREELRRLAALPPRRL